MTSLVVLIALAQFPAAPDKTPPLPQKTTPSPQSALATPQQEYTPVSQAILRVPSSYMVQRQVIVRDIAPVVNYQTSYSVAADVAPVSCGVALAYAGQGCGVAQQVVVQRNVVSHNIAQQAVVNHAVVAGAGRAPRKVVTKQVTKVRRGLLGGLFGG